VISGKKIAVLGLSFKKDTDDIRESVSIKLVNSLLENGAIVSAHDPMAIENSRKIFGNKITFHDDVNGCIENVDCCVIMTDWDVYKNMNEEVFYKMKQRVIIDARRVLDATKFKNNVRFVGMGMN
ncbi:MAG: UDP binding domain-containing protein, partial [Nitrososphaeraceae archaeon]